MPAPADTLDTIVTKVQKLLRLSTSSNAHEAALAAAKAQELIDRHQLSQALLEMDTAHPIEQEAIVNFGARNAPLFHASQLPRWRLFLAVTIARSNACRIYRNQGHIQIIGRPSDVETVRYLFAYLAGEVDRLTADHGQGCGISWRNNFRLGVVETIREKLLEARRGFEDQVRREAGADARALVRVNQALMRLEERSRAVDEWTRANLKLYASRGGSGAYYDANAREQGRRAGQAIVLNRARAALSGRRGLLAE